MIDSRPVGENDFVFPPWIKLPPSLAGYEADDVIAMVAAKIADPGENPVHPKSRR